MGMCRDSLLRKVRGAEGKHAANNALKYGLAFIFFTTLLLACDPPAGSQPQPQPTVETPTFSPAGADPGASPVAVLTTDSLAISSETDGASIRYTLGLTPPADGTDTLAAPTATTGTQYSTSQTFAALADDLSGEYPKNITIKAIAFKTNSHSISPVGSANFRVLEQLAAPTFDPPETITRGGQLTINAPTGATVRYIAGTSAAPPDDPETETSGTRYDSDNKPTFASLLPAGGTLVIKARAFMTDRYPSVVVRAEYTVPPQPQVAPLSFDPASGEVLSTATLTISTSTMSTTIYYTMGDNTVANPTLPDTPGGDPTPPTIKYDGPVRFDTLGEGEKTIKAIAVREGYASSIIAMTSFTIERDVDRNNNGLMEIDNLDMLNNIRYNLAGTSYDDDSTDEGTEVANSGSKAGAPTAAQAMASGYMCRGRTAPNNLCGYELTRGLDFSMQAHYASGSMNYTNNTWRPDMTNPDNATNAGFVSIGAQAGSSNPNNFVPVLTGGFSAIFEGNGHTITNLYSRNSMSTGRTIGLFGLVSSDGRIRNAELSNARVYGGSGKYDLVGALVGSNNGEIRASHALMGTQDGEGGDQDSVGGLVGYNRATIRASHATGNPNGGLNNFDNVGGLVGQNAGTITASYATGDPNDGAGSGDNVGGLVGRNAGTITASYATGHPNDGIGGNNRVGGLVGQNAGTITASYATGNSKGGVGNRGRVGGLVGENDASGTIIASYASGNSDGGAGTDDRVGGLVGENNASSTITASYAFGTSSNGETDGHDGSPKPTGVTTDDLQLLKGDSGDATTYAGVSWDRDTDSTKGAWNFGSNSQNPALVYADYDGTSSGIDYCSMYPSTITCGTTLLPGQGR